MDYASLSAAFIGVGRAIIPAAVAPAVTLETINMEGLTSLVRIAMFPYAPPDTKIKLSAFAIDFELSYKIGSINATGMTRYMKGEGRKDFAVIKQIAGIVLQLMPPIPTQKDKLPHPITEIYLFAIEGLKFIKDQFFKEEPPSNKVPDLNNFGLKYDSSKHPIITDSLAGSAVIKAINLFDDCCKKKMEPMKELTELQIKVKQGYSDLLIKQLANGLKLLKERKGESPVTTEWCCESEFQSLDKLLQGRLVFYEKLVQNASSLLPTSSIKK